MTAGDGAVGATTAGCRTGAVGAAAVGLADADAGSGSVESRAVEVTAVVDGAGCRVGRGTADVAGSSPAWWVEGWSEESAEIVAWFPVVSQAVAAPVERPMSASNANPIERCARSRRP